MSESDLTPAPLFRAAAAMPSEHADERLNPTRGPMGWVVVDADDLPLDLRALGVKVDRSSYLEREHADAYADACNALFDLRAALGRVEAIPRAYLPGGLVDTALTEIRGGIDYLYRARLLPEEA